MGYTFYPSFTVEIDFGEEMTVIPQYDTNPADPSNLIKKGYQGEVTVDMDAPLYERLVEAFESREHLKYEGVTYEVVSYYPNYETGTVDFVLQSIGKPEHA